MERRLERTKAFKLVSSSFQFGLVEHTAIDLVLLGPRVGGPARAVNDAAGYMCRNIRRARNRLGGDFLIFLGLVGTDKGGKPQNTRNGKEGHRKAQKAQWRAEELRAEKWRQKDEAREGQNFGWGGLRLIEATRRAAVSARR